MESIPDGGNLLELRRSEINALAALLSRASRDDLAKFDRSVSATLAMFSTVAPENEEQIFLFGADMRRLLDRAVVPMRPSVLHRRTGSDVTIVFGGGFFGWSLAETLARKKNPLWLSIP